MWQIEKYVNLSEKGGNILRYFIKHVSVFMLFPSFGALSYRPIARFAVQIVDNVQIDQGRRRRLKIVIGP